MSEKAKPLFTQSEEAIDEAFKEEMGNMASPGHPKRPGDRGNTWADYVPPAQMKLNHRQRRFAELIFMGISSREAARTCGYTKEYAANLAKTPVILDEVERIRDKSFAKPVEERLKGMGTKALDVAEEILSDPNIDPIKKESILKWVVEMQIGKANQKVSVDGNLGIGVFLDRLDQLKNVTPTPKQIIEGESAKVIEPTEEKPETSEEPKDNFTEWLDKNM